MDKLRSKLKQFKLTGKAFNVFYEGSEWRVRRGEVCAIYRIADWDMVLELYTIGYCSHDNDAESIITALQVIKLENIGRRMAAWK